MLRNEINTMLRAVAIILTYARINKSLLSIRAVFSTVDVRQEKKRSSGEAAARGAVSASRCLIGPPNLESMGRAHVRPPRARRRARGGRAADGLIAADVSLRTSVAFLTVRTYISLSNELVSAIRGRVGGGGGARAL
ncbi:hypothetical protein EVAR_63082_1 [Eumeta japonica]|uniref:Uncharacterized protein n=1 Tax=Eumeta variegata TaxID=151549 RepID=A0A4C2A0U0_EUMVA|nr:hypothetical protein EVAR_63082_1 [Eumeta japonica]